ncbi:glycosyl transferase [Frondihabitans sucicola]|uniref:Glycosyl transferase n=1 Tax=Frondihabitans sucicola TaxID=1268041 RepID=A0ABN6Y219_9MICO|nr:glycosyltransferase [Frondihabitans sucicola]BDZ51374.1 glycosyl transferase [Frondihabitans sucicola]
MRLLLSAVPAHGHVLPLAPLARAALSRGHDVAILTSAGLRATLEHELPGIELLPAGPMPDVVFAEVSRRTGKDALAGEDPSAVAEFFAGIRVDLTVDEALAAARAWRPDVIVADACDFVGPLVAASLGVPWHLLAFGPAMPDEVTTPMREVVASRYAARGLTPAAPLSYLDPCPPSLQIPEWLPPASRVAIRPEAYRGGSSRGPTAGFDARDDTDRIVVTLGTVFSQPDLLEAIIAGFDLDSVSVVATLGVLPGVTPPADTDAVRYVTFVPLSELLADADVVVSAGGAGTVLAALANGLPLVLLPQGADQPLNAARAEATGAALVVHDPSAVGPAVERLRHDRRFRAAAQRVASEIAAMPDPVAVVDSLIPVGIQ